MVAPNGSGFRDPEEWKLGLMVLALGLGNAKVHGNTDVWLPINKIEASPPTRITLFHEAEP